LNERAGFCLEALDPFSSDGGGPKAGAQLRGAPYARALRRCLCDLFRKPFAKGRAEGLEFPGRAALQIDRSKNI